MADKNQDLVDRGVAAIGATATAIGLAMGLALQGIQKAMEDGLQELKAIKDEAEQRKAKAAPDDSVTENE